MTAERRRTLVHATLAAGALALIGVMYAELAGMWVAGQSVERNGPPVSTPGPDIAGAIKWRLPAAMAVAGFLLVLGGESLTSLWRKPAAAAEPPKRDFDKEAEAKIQQMLKESQRQG